MMKLKKEQMREEKNREQENASGIKDAKHLKPEHMERINENYEPYLHQMETKLRGALVRGKTLKQTSKITEVAKAEFTNADQSKILEGTIAQFLDGLRKQQ